MTEFQTAFGYSLGEYTLRLWRAAVAEAHRPMGVFETVEYAGFSPSHATYEHTDIDVTLSVEGLISVGVAGTLIGSVHAQRGIDDTVDALRMLARMTPQYYWGWLKEAEFVEV